MSLRSSLLLPLLLLSCGGEPIAGVVDGGLVDDDAMATPDADTLCDPELFTTFFRDVDGDGYGSPTDIAIRCTRPDGFVENDLDCDDRDSRINPDGVERCDGLDNDCSAATVEVCPSQCSPQTDGTTVYLFCNEGASHANAESTCSGEGMHLVRVDQEEEQTFLAAQRVVAFGAFREVWIGGSDAVAEGAWLWQDGTPFWQGTSGGVAIGGLYTFWSPGEPNNDDNEDCAILRDNAPGTWDDRSCGAGHRFVCERDNEIY